VRTAFCINGRFRAHRIAGTQRYITEVSKRFTTSPRLIEPNEPLKGVRGHAWEQTILPTLARGTLLWSPSNTGPLNCEDQIVTIHDLFPLENPEWFTLRFRMLWRLIVPRLVRRARHLIAVSHYTKERLVSLLGVDDRKITVIHHGLSEAFYPRPQREIQPVLARHGIKNPYVVAVSSLEPRKNLPRLLEAWESLGNLGEAATLVVVGAKGSSAVFRDCGLTRISKGVRFTGYVPDEDLPALYSGAKALVYPSLNEGFGLPVLEALACGTRVISSNSTSIPEVAGGMALLIDPYSPQAIARSLKLIIESDHNPGLSAEGRSHARSFTWEKSAAATESVLLSHS
jgi:glycosyltransferase involved in cell wall biosynthesis